MYALSFLFFCQSTVYPAEPRAPVFMHEYVLCKTFDPLGSINSDTNSSGKYTGGVHAGDTWRVDDCVKPSCRESMSADVISAEMLWCNAGWVIFVAMITRCQPHLSRMRISTTSGCFQSSAIITNNSVLINIHGLKSTKTELMTNQSLFLLRHMISSFINELSIRQVNWHLLYLRLLYY